MRNIYLLLYESQGLALWVWFDAASVVGGCGVEDPHQALQRVLESDNGIMDVMTWYSTRNTLVFNNGSIFKTYNL